MSFAPTSYPLVGGAEGRAPGVCGELAQGMLANTYFLVTCPVDFFARVRVELYRGPAGVVAPSHCPKTADGVARTLAHLGRSNLRAQVAVSNPIPRSKGLGSSSADLAAAIAATAWALGEDLPPEQIGRLALQVEPTDGVMYPGIVLFDHRTGSMVEELGPPLPLEIVALDFGGAVDTVDFNQVDRFDQWQAIQPQTDEALGLVREGLGQGDVKLLGQGATISAVAGQRILFKPQLPAVRDFAAAAGAVGVNVAHSGAVIGVLLDATKRQGKSVFRQARRHFPEAEAVHHFRLLSGGAQSIQLT